MLSSPFLRRLAALFLLALGGCAGPNTSLYPPRPGGLTNTVYVVNHGSLHTGLTIRRGDIPPGLWPGNRRSARSKYIEVGWGDDDGYRKPLTPGIALKALSGSHRTVLLTDAFRQGVREKYADPKFTVLAVELSRPGFARLCRHVDETCARDANGKPIPLGDGWFRARGTYSAFNTCNTWVASALRKAGCPISPALCSMPGQLLGRVRPFARPIR